MIFKRALERSAQPLSLLFYFMLIANILFASAIYYAEAMSPSANPSDIDNFGDPLPAFPFDSIPRAMYWCMVTMTTVGYGDKAPITRTGRSITAVWMVMSLVAVSTLTAGLASAFTVLLSGSTQEKVKDPGELALLRVAAVNGTSGMELAERRKLRIVAAESLDKGIEAVLNNTADALIFDRPALRYHLKLNPDLAVKVAPFTLAEETYGFVLRWDDPLRTPLDVSILKLQRQGRVEAMVNSLMD